MKILILPFILFSFWSFSQPIKFKGESVDSVFIKSHLSAYQFDDNGTTKGTESTFSIGFKAENNGYFVDEYLIKDFVASYKTESAKVKTKTNNNKIGHKISDQNLEYLLRALNSSVNVAHLKNQIDTVAFQSYVTERRIQKIAKLLKIDWYFSRRYSTIEENQLFFKSFMSTDSLEIFLLNHFSQNAHTIVTDFESSFTIYVVTSSQNYMFEAKYPNTYKQPWYSYSDTAEILPRMILNFDVNNALVKILPENFLLIETISPKTLFNAYITWCFERSKML